MPIETDPTTTSSSLIARAGQIMVVIIILGLVSMISSMLVSESLSGDAAQINIAGSLRMHAMRISRAHLADTSQQKLLIKKETTAFENQLNQLLIGGLVSARKNKKIEEQYQLILENWQKLNSNNSDHSVHTFDTFVSTIDQMVFLLQKESEKKLNMLRLIQGISLLSVLVVAIVVLFQLNRIIVAPLKQLVDVASEAGKGNFDLKATYHSDNELGLLARTINQMSAELKLTYQDYEQRVTQKTEELLQSNRSLDFLYKTARYLSANDFSHGRDLIIQELENILGEGKITIELLAIEDNQSQKIDIHPRFNAPFCLLSKRFPLKKHGNLFGYIVWQTPTQFVISEWQTLMLQAIADIVGTALQLERQRSVQNRLLIIEERAVIARELHDSLAQSLSYLKFQMSLLSRKMQKEVPKEQLTMIMDDIKQGINSAYLQLRELLTTFRLKLEDPSIENAIQGTVAEFSTKCNHPIFLNYQIEPESLSANQEIHLLQIIREALSNIQRHAHSTEAGIHIHRMSENIIVEIWDNGQGIKNLENRQGHLGLSIMRERAKSLNAVMEILARQPQGTRIIIKLHPKRFQQQDTSQ
ncbi:histidine kinase [Aliikangiella maris]|uniref:Sensor protein n=2 Tax=Aliikangiella maris TaxID=3162458 RepID=A0ABV3MMD1_9GAMM